MVLKTTKKFCQQKQYNKWKIIQLVQNDDGDDDEIYIMGKTISMLFNTIWYMVQSFKGVIEN